MKDFVKLNQTFFCLSLGMSGSLWAKRASIFSISDVVNVDGDVDVDDDAAAATATAAATANC